MTAEIRKWPEDAIALDDIDAPRAWIQWKGTEVCMDVRCACGHHGHVDESFAYFYACPKCGVRYAVGQNVRLYPIAADRADAIAPLGGSCVVTSCIDDDDNHVEPHAGFADPNVEIVALRAALLLALDEWDEYRTLYFAERNRDGVAPDSKIAELRELLK